MDHSIPKGESPAPAPAPKKKKRIARLVFWLLFLGFIIIQFFQPDKNNNSYSAVNHIASLAPVPDTVNEILLNACYDCHSNNTRYPWYTNIQPVGWWLANHISDGKRHLNFSEFAGYATKKQLKKLEEIKEVLDDGSMPLGSYTWIHKKAILSDPQKKLIKNWVDSASKAISLLPVKS